MLFFLNESKEKLIFFTLSKKKHEKISKKRDRKHVKTPHTQKRTTPHFFSRRHSNETVWPS